MTISSKHIAILIVAAGTGSRAADGTGNTPPKQYRQLAGKPLIRHTLEALQTALPGADILTVIHPDHTPLYTQATNGLPNLLPPATGGATRQKSVQLGLEALQQHAPKYVLIHDAARPFITAEEISHLLDALQHHKAAILATPEANTLKRVIDGHITATEPRNKLWCAQTPQGFDYATILELHQRFADTPGFTDDAQLAEAANIPVAIVEGSRGNIKLTTGEDMQMAAKLLAPLPDIRTATGYDVHRFAESPATSVRIGGVDIPHARALEGHSDADVLLHAITDALLGTIAAEDIGAHFSPKDPQWKGKDSAHFLRHAIDLVQAQGGTLRHIDSTIIAETPKLAPHRDAIRTRIASITGLDITRISVKATTTEGLGFTGRQEGIAAQAVVTVYF